MARRLPLLLQPMCGPKWSSLIPSSYPGWSSRQCSGPSDFYIFINDLSDSLENSLYLFADDSTLCRTNCHPSDQQAAASSLSADLGKITNWSNTWNMSFNPDKSRTLTMSLRKDRFEPHRFQSQSTTGNLPSCKVLPRPT